MTTDPSREAFEKWAISDFLSVNRSLDGTDGYFEGDSHIAWQAWQAAMAHKDAERWQPIETAPKDGRSYLVSDRGNVSVDGSIRNPYATDKGYLRTTIAGKSFAVHRLVANAFLPNPGNLREVNHIDGDKKNNSSCNLEWCSRSQNMKHAYSIGLHPGVRLSGKDSPNWGRSGELHPQSTPVRATFKDDTYRDYASQGMAQKDGFCPSKISLCINGHRKTHGGATWMPLPAAPLQQGE